MASFFERLDDAGGVEAGSTAPRWLERAAFLFLVVMVIAAPHSIAASQAAWILGMLATLLRFAFLPRSRFRSFALPAALLCLLIWSAVSSAFSFEPAISLDKLRNVSLLLVFFFAYLNIRRMRAVYLLSFLLVLSCLVNVGWAIGGRIAGRGVEIHGLAPDGPLARLEVPIGATLVSLDGKKLNSPDEIVNALKNDIPSRIIVYEYESYRAVEMDAADLVHADSPQGKLGITDWSRSYNWRAQGFFGHFTTYAESLQLIASLLFGLIVGGLVRKERSESRFAIIRAATSTPVMIAALAAILIALLLTVTRASQLAFMVSAFSIIVLSGSRKLLIAAGLLAVPVVLGGLLFLQQSRNVGLLDTNDESTLYRLTMWQDGMRLSTAGAHNLVFGIGMDSTKKHWQEWGMFRGGFMPFGHFHSTPVQMMVERGVPALLIWLAVLFLYGRTLWRAIRRSKTMDASARWPLGILLGCFGALAGFFVSGLVHYNIGDGEVALIFYLLMAIGVRTAELISDNETDTADAMQMEYMLAA